MHKNIFTNKKVKEILKHLCEWGASGLIGAIIGMFFSLNYFKAFIITIIFSVITFIVLVILSCFDKKYDILGILKAEISAGNHPTVIQIGYTLSRPLHLSGRYAMREAIGHQTLNACRKLDASRKIRINDTKVSVRYIEAKTLIDDLGWNVYLLGQSDVAIENIETGIEIAKSLSEYKLVVKGYRHILGICDAINNKEKRDNAEASARTILNSQEYRATFLTDEAYHHAVAEFNYAYAKTLIDENSDKALEIALNVQKVFSAEQTEDMDRYCKTFDLIGDIYAYSEKPEKLKKSRSVYLKGITECERHGRSERLIRIAIDYINLLLKMMRVCPNIFGFSSWEQQIDKEEKDIYDKARICTERVENKNLMQKLKQQHKDYLKNRKRMRKEHRHGN